MENTGDPSEPKTAASRAGQRQNDMLGFQEQVSFPQLLSLSLPFHRLMVGQKTSAQASMFVFGSFLAEKREEEKRKESENRSC